MVVFFVENKHKQKKHASNFCLQIWNNINNTMSQTDELDFAGRNALDMGVLQQFKPNSLRRVNLGSVIFAHPLTVLRAPEPHLPLYLHATIEFSRLNIWINKQPS